MLNWGLKMLVAVAEAVTVFDKYHATGLRMKIIVPLRYNASNSESKLVKYGDEFSSALGQELLDAKVESIELRYDTKLVVALIKTFPVKYRRPYGKIDFFKMDKVLQVLKKINRKSQRQRHVILLNELYAGDNDREILFESGEKLTYDKWNSIKPKIDKKETFFYRYKECGIIVFVDLRPGGENFLNRFYKNSDLVTSLVGHRHDDNVSISSDFIREYDVFTVDEPEKLLEVYKESNARLIIVGDVLSDEYKKALFSVKGYDTYARFMLATNIDQKNREQFLVQVAKSYHADNYNLDDY